MMRYDYERMTGDVGNEKKRLDENKKMRREDARRDAINGNKTNEIR
jgi:hypothetical protein